MKIALLGNCQLQQIGWLLKNYFEQNKLPHEVVWHAPIFALGDQNADVVPMFQALDQADAIYGQFHEKRWNVFSTDSLSKHFDIKIVPTLESLASAPQMNYFSNGSLKLGLYTVDFRMLELYLQGIAPERVPEVYGLASVNPLKRQNAIDNTAAKYRALYRKGKILFDYADVYAEAMMSSTDPYYVHNHPNNTHLEWLTNLILKDAGIPVHLSFANLPDILTDTIVPAFGQGPQATYRLRSADIGLKTATKVYYTFFSTYERAFLEQELEHSNYRALCESPF
jgi:hypothetical protein